MRGHEVQVAFSGPTALEAAAAFAPEVVLLDIGLPGLDGYEVARSLRQQRRTAKATLVALTGYGQEEDRRLAREAGFDHHLTKPVDPAVIYELVEVRERRVGARRLRERRGWHPSSHDS
jgi:two-component system CheB/CheR fusion protein